MSAIVIGENDGTVSYVIGPSPPSSPLAVDFPYFFPDEIVVTQVVGPVETVLVADVDYTLAGVAADDGFWSGAVTLVTGLTNCTIRIDRALRTSKASNFPETGAISIPGMNTLFSRLFSLLQDLRRSIDAIGDSYVGDVTSGTGILLDREGHSLGIEVDYEVVAPLASPAFRGFPTAPEPPPGDDSDLIATTGWVMTQIDTMLALIFAQDQPYLAPFLGYQNVFVRGVPWSFSQQGDFASCSWNVVGRTITVTGPNTELPAGQLWNRPWNMPGRLMFVPFNGQSNAGGTNSNFSGVTDPLVMLMHAAPKPTNLKAVNSGFIPTQGGIASVNVTEIINPANYQGPLVDGKEGINTLRTPGNEHNAQTFASSFCNALANSVPSTTIVVPIGVPHGSTRVTDDLEHAVNLNALSWNAGVASMIFVSSTNLAVGDQFTLATQIPSAWRGNYIVASSDGIHVTANVAVDPGVPTTLGYGLVASAPMVNLRNIIRYHVAVTAPALGLKPEMPFFLWNGNEANDDTALVVQAASFYDTMFKYIAEFSAICGNTEPCELVAPQVGFPVAAWQQPDASMLNCANAMALAALQYAYDDTKHLITYAQYPQVAGGLGDGNAVGCIHYGVQGHWDSGQRGYNEAMNKKLLGSGYKPPCMLTGIGNLTYVAGSTVITGTLSEACVVNNASTITDPGKSGFQVYAGIGLTGNGGNGFERTLISSIAIAGTALTINLSAPLTPAYGINVGYAYNNAVRYVAANNTPITGGTWVGGVATLSTAPVAHGLGVGDSTAIWNMGAWNIFPGVPSLAGTAGTTIVMPLAANPGAFVPGGNVANNGIFGVGRNKGLRGRVQALNGTYFDCASGAPLIRPMAIQLAKADCYSTATGVMARLAALGLNAFFEMVHDYANSACYDGSSQVVNNLGTSGTLANYILGLNSSPDSRDPNFVGTAGALVKTAYFNAGASNKMFDPQGTPAFHANMHKAGGGGTLILGIGVPASFTHNNYLWSSAIGEGPSQNPGIFTRLSTSRALTFGVEGDGGSAVYSRVCGTIPANSLCLVGLGWKDSNPNSWSYLSSDPQATRFVAFNPVYASPSVNPSNLPYIWQNGLGTGSLQMAEIGMQIYFALGSSQMLEAIRAESLMRSLDRYLNQGL